MVPAPAKINLALEVLGRRPDGYHEVVTVLQRLALHDDLSFTPAGDLSLTCDRPDLAGDANLALRAARLLREASGTPLGAHIALRKRIPVAAGLGGGSADAAAALIGLAQLWRLPAGREALLGLAAQLGSDVPFFLNGPTALAEGRGEQLRPLRSPVPHWAVLAVPRLEIPEKTRRLYAALTPADYSDGATTRALAAALDAGRPLDPRLLVNTFERLALQHFPPLAACREALLAAGAPWARLSGAGPALFTLLRDPDSARTLHDRLLARLMPHEATVLLTHTEA